MTAVTRPAPAFLNIYDDKTCIGFVIPRSRVGFEAFDRDERSLGTFPTMREAAAAIPKSAAPGDN